MVRNWDLRGFRWSEIYEGRRAFETAPRAQMSQEIIFTLNLTARTQTFMGNGKWSYIGAAEGFWFCQLLCSERHLSYSIQNWEGGGRTQDECINRRSV